MKIRTRDQLIAYLDAGNTAKYVFFWGHREKSSPSKSCFSQWYESPFVVEGHTFPTAEHFMMFHKATLFGDHVAAQKVLQAATPAAAKAIGREVLGFNQTLWEQKRFEIVVNATVAKFAQHPLLGDFLQSTGDRVLVEASPVDPIWGIGLAQDSPAAADPRTWKGLNLLGFALIEVREILQNT